MEFIAVWFCLSYILLLFQISIYLKLIIECKSSGTSKFFVFLRIFPTHLREELHFDIWWQKVVSIVSLILALFVLVFFALLFLLFKLLCLDGFDYSLCDLFLTNLVSFIPLQESSHFFNSFTIRTNSTFGFFCILS
jgi:hypothetical protein